MTGRVLLPVAICMLRTNFAGAQGGPPMITDDPGTPGNGHFENNLAITFEHRPNDYLVELPAIDINYGLGDHIQLTLQTAYVIRKHHGQGFLGGMGSTEVALKWRFLDQETDGVSMSTFPRVIFNLNSSSRRGLTDDGTRLQLPFQLARSLGPLDLDLEVGPLLPTIGRSEWLYGVVAGIHLSRPTELMAEIHGSSRTNFTRDIETLNVGFRQQIKQACILIASLGHDVHASNDEPLAWIGYCGVQLLY